MLFNYGVGEDLRVLWTARRSNQSIIEEIIPDIHWKHDEAETPILWPADGKN